MSAVLDAYADQLALAAQASTVPVLTLPGSIYPYCDDDSDDVKMANLMFIFKSRVEKTCAQMMEDDSSSRVQFDAWWQDINKVEQVRLYNRFRAQFAKITSAG